MKSEMEKQETIFFKEFSLPRKKRDSQRKASESNSILDSLRPVQTFSHAARKYTQEQRKKKK